MVALVEQLLKAGVLVQAQGGTGLRRVSGGALAGRLCCWCWSAAREGARRGWLVGALDRSGVVDEARKGVLVNAGAR